MSRESPEHTKVFAQPERHHKSQEAQKLQSKGRLLKTSNLGYGMMTRPKTDLKISGYDLIKRVWVEIGST